MEVADANSNVSTDTAGILLRWKTDYENLYSDTVNPNFDEDHLRHVKNSVLSRNAIPPIDIDVAALNAEITLVEVEISVFRAKLRKAAGLDTIPAEALQNASNRCLK